MNSYPTNMPPQYAHPGQMSGAFPGVPGVPGVPGLPQGMSGAPGMPMMGQGADPHLQLLQQQAYIAQQQQLAAMGAGAGASQPARGPQQSGKKKQGRVSFLKFDDS